MKEKRESAPSARLAGAKQIERLVAEIIENLPSLEKRILDAALAETKEHPRSALHYLFGRFTGGTEAERAVAGYLLRVHGGADVVDSLNGVVFDMAQDARTKILANDILAELGNAVDPDVFAMSVPDAESFKEPLPSRMLQLLAEGNIKAAVEHVRAFTPTVRYLMLHDAAARYPEQAPALLESLARDDEGTTTAVISVIAVEQLGACVPLLLDLQNRCGRQLQKLIKRILFDLRKAGIEVPEEKQSMGAPVQEEKADGELPVYRATMSDLSADGRALVMVARERPNGRLKVFSVVVDVWKRGIQQAALRLDMSRSAFERFAGAQSGQRSEARDVSVAECRRLVARGLRVAREFGSPIPMDFGLGKALLGPVEEEAEALENLFPCSVCAKPLDAESVERIRATAAYHQMHVETRCKNCREAAEKA